MSASAAVRPNKFGLAKHVLFDCFPNVGNWHGWRTRKHLYIQSRELEVIVMGSPTPSGSSVLSPMML